MTIEFFSSYSILIAIGSTLNNNNKYGVLHGNVGD